MNPTHVSFHTFMLFRIYQSFCNVSLSELQTVFFFFLNSDNFHLVSEGVNAVHSIFFALYIIIIPAGDTFHNKQDKTNTKHRVALD